MSFSKFKKRALGLPSKL